jgi:hypothetical protein
MDWGSSIVDSPGRNSVTDTMLDMRDAPPPSLANETFRDALNHHGALTPGTTFSAAGCSSRSSLVADTSQRDGGSNSFPEQNSDSAFLMGRGNAGPRLTLDWLLQLSQHADSEVGAHSGRGSVPSLGGLLSGRSFVVDSTASPTTSGLPTTRSALLHPSAPTSARLTVASLSNSPDVEVLSDSGVLQTSLFPLQWEDSHLHVDADTDGESEDNVVSVFDISNEATSARLIDVNRYDEHDPGRPSSPSWDSGTGVWSTVSSARTHTSVRPASAGARSPMGLREATEIALLNGSLNTILQRLTSTSESQLLDESLTRSVRRVLQIGTALAGERLTDAEIRGLPKVRFEAAEQQNCSICLEPFQDGELVTSLPCSHFFHVDCVGRWMQRATLCPLCRKPCCQEHEL